jgi:hypothetical protein
MRSQGRVTLRREAVFRTSREVDMTQPERRKEERQDDDTDDWETIALRRVARRVESLPESPPHADDFGWEEGVLDNLRKHLAAND